MIDILWHIGLGCFVFGFLALAYIVVTGLAVNWRPRIK